MLSTVTIVGIGTEVGKTLVSAILCKALNATYWKPIQSGFLNGQGDRDSIWVQKMSGADFLPEAYLLQEPLSPHIAAQIDGIVISTDQLILPAEFSPLVVETAGGIMVPLNDQELMVDVLSKWKTPVMLVVRQYLGNINHTLLAIEALKSRNIPILGWISNGSALPDTLRWIQQYTQVPLLLEIPEVQNLDKEFIQDMAQQLKENLEKNGLEFKR